MIRKTAYLTCIAALTACSNSVETDGPFFLGDSKAPVALSVGVEMTAKPKRAVDHTFDTGDKMVAHLQHVLKEGETYTTQGGFAKNVILTMRSNPAMTQVGDTKVWQTADFYTDPVLYWDDFSSTADDIRLANHGLRLAWGYCYNDPDAADAIYETATDELPDYSVQQNQNAKSNFQKSDLLWAKTQEMVPYEHGTQNQDPNRKGLVIPYTHAMSKATIVVTADETFGETPFAATTVTLHNVHTAGTFTASTAKVSGAYTSGDITMQKTASGRTATFEAVFVPHTALADRKLWATLTDVEGNTYEIRLNNNILADGKWGAISETKSGVNYLLNVTISKQGITVMAQIVDWTDVTAEGTGIIKFVPDNTITGTIANELKAGGMDIYKNSAEQVFTDVSTTVTWDSGTGTWNYAPTIYWAGQGDASYFRALSPTGTGTGTDNMAQGRDVLWGYASDTDKSKVGTANEERITPRTGDVPLQFEHAMSKVTINLKTADDAAAKVNFDGATLALTSLNTKGTLSMLDGTITPSTLTKAAYTKTHTATGSAQYALTITAGAIFIPQTISDDARLILTLADGTTYSLTLNLCEDDKGPIGAWAQGKHYIYDISVAKETITFRAVVKNWVEAKGNGNANLDWD